MSVVAATAQLISMALTGMYVFHGTHAEFETAFERHPRLGHLEVVSRAPVAPVARFRLSFDEWKELMALCGAQIVYLNNWASAC